jgi:hypothetical protein
MRFEIVPNMNKSFMMFADEQKFAAEVYEKQFVYIDTSFVTKTRVNTSLYLPGFAYKFNGAVDGFQTHEKTQWGMFSGKQETSHYFKIMKRQRIEEYKSYVEALLRRRFGAIIEDDKFVVKLLETGPIRVLQGSAT